MLLKGKQIKDKSISLDKLKDSGEFVLSDSSRIQLTGTASNPDDPVSFKELDNLGSKLEVEDYKSGKSVTDVSKMIFRGNTIMAPDNEEVDGVLATGGDNVVTVWVPAPIYADYFNEKSNKVSKVSTTNRFISDPSTNGNYGVTGWSPGSQRPTLNSGYNGIFTYEVSNFACFNTNGDITITIYGDDGTIVKELNHTLDSENGSKTENGLTINVTSFNEDNDRYKATVKFKIDLNSSGLIPNGGKFKVKLSHNNDGDVSGPSEFTQTMFYDRDTENGTSSANISGVTSMEEKTPNLKYLSGVAYYKSGSSFDVSVKGMDLLNEITYPTNGQLSLDFSTNSGIGDDNNITSSNFIGWDNLWDTSDVEYSKVYSIGSGNLTTPGLDGNNNLNSSNKTSLTAKVHDWVKNVDSKKSPDYNWLILNKGGTPTRTKEPLNDESRRIKVKDLVLDGNVSPFDSQSGNLNTTGSDYEYELQQIQGESNNGSTRLVYPKINFKSWLPIANSTTDYSSVVTKDLNINVITNENGRVTQTETFSGYRWYVRSFETGTGVTAPTQTNGIFKFGGNFSESDITSGNLKLFISLDGIADGDFENKWYDLTESFTSNGGGCRADKVGNNLDNNGRIKWNVGSNHSGKRVYILIGIKNTTTTKRFTSIETEGGAWV